MSGRSDSPTFFHGQPWSSWIERIGRDKPLSDDEPESEPSSSVTRLSVDDIDLYGFCPERDTFYGVVCEICNAIVKPQALIQHMECRHPSGTGNLPPPSNPIIKPAVKTPYCKLSKLKKNQSSPQLPINSTKISNHTSVKRSTETTNLHSFPSAHSPESLQVQQTNFGSNSNSNNTSSSNNNGSNNNSSGVNNSSSPVKSPGQPKRKKLKTERSLLKDREYDPDRHCGVWIEETSKPCTRSLTCKAHTVSLRRTVVGRSKSFDKLLAEHRAAKELPTRQTKASSATDVQPSLTLNTLVSADQEGPSSPPVLSLPDTYPLPQAVDLLYRSLAPHGSTKPNKLEEDFVSEELRLDSSLSSGSTVAAATAVATAPASATVAPSITTVLPSLSPLPAVEESSSGASVSAQTLPGATTSISPSEMVAVGQQSVLFAPLTTFSDYKVPKFEHEHLANGKRIANCTSNNSNVSNSRNSNSVSINSNNNSSPRSKCEYGAQESFAIQLEATATPAHFSDISWSNCHPEPLAVSRWLRLTSSRKQYNFNIH